MKDRKFVVGLTAGSTIILAADECTCTCSDHDVHRRDTAKMSKAMIRAALEVDAAVGLRHEAQNPPSPGR